MTARRPQPKVQRVIPTFMAYPRRQQPAPDSAWTSAAIVGWAVTLLGVVYVIASKTGSEYAPGTLLALGLALYATDRAWKQ